MIIAQTAGWRIPHLPAAAADNTVFTHHRFEALPLVDTVPDTLTNKFTPPPYAPPTSLLSTAGMLTDSTQALSMNTGYNGRVFTAYRLGDAINGYEPSMPLVENGFTTEMFLYREGGLAFDGSWSFEGFTEIENALGEYDTLYWWILGDAAAGGAVEVGFQVENFWESGAYYETPVVMPDGVWTHLAIVVEGATIRVYFGGVLTLTGSLPLVGEVTTGHSFVYASLMGYFFDTHVRAIDEYRVTGKVLYTGASFTPPTAIFPYPPQW